MCSALERAADKNVDPGLVKWGSTIGPNLLEYIPSSAKLSEMVQTGEAAIFPLTPTAVATQKARGVPMEYAQAKEGSVLLMVSAPRKYDSLTLCFSQSRVELNLQKFVLLSTAGQSVFTKCPPSTGITTPVM